MRNPNGYGSVIKLGGNRRKPYCARVTTGWTDDGKQICKPVGYYVSASEANIALADYNKNPFSLESNITFAQAYRKWSVSKFSAVSNSSVLGYKAAFKTCAPLHDVRMVDIKKNHMQHYFDNPDIGHGSKRKILVLLKAIFRYALENDIVSKDYTDFIDMPKNESLSDREPFTLSEIDVLFKNYQRLEYIDTILILIFTGFRIGELLDVKMEDVDIEGRFIIGGNKTASSKRRLVPINNKILPLVYYWYEMGGEYLIKNPKGGQMNYFTYYDVHWKNIMEKLGMKHKPHDTRHTCATLLDNAGANKVARQRILGHQSKDVTDKVYTHKDKEQLLKAIDLI